MRKVIIVGCSEAEDMACAGRILGVTHAVQILAPGGAPFPEIAPNRLRLRMGDVVDANESCAPKKEDVRDIISYVTKLPRDASVLFHCHLGISRSAAAAFISMIALDGKGSEVHSAKRIMQIRPIARPNALMIRHADSLLGYNGQLLDLAATVFKPAKRNMPWVGSSMDYSSQ